MRQWQRWTRTWRWQQIQRNRSIPLGRISRQATSTEVFCSPFPPFSRSSMPSTGQFWSTGEGWMTNKVKINIIALSNLDKVVRSQIGPLQKLHVKIIFFVFAVSAPVQELITRGTNCSFYLSTPWFVQFKPHTYV